MLLAIRRVQPRELAGPSLERWLERWQVRLWARFHGDWLAGARPSVAQPVRQPVRQSVAAQSKRRKRAAVLERAPAVEVSHVAAPALSVGVWSRPTALEQQPALAIRPLQPVRRRRCRRRPIVRVRPALRPEFARPRYRQERARVQPPLVRALLGSHSVRGFRWPARSALAPAVPAPGLVPGGGPAGPEEHHRENGNNDEPEGAVEPCPRTGLGCRA